MSELKKDLGKSTHYVYVLVKDNNPIYVGCSSDLHNRINTHKSSKDFDYYVVLKEYDNKKDALIAENSLIRFVSMFGGDEWLNAKYMQLSERMSYVRLFNHSN